MADGEKGAEELWRMGWNIQQERVAFEHAAQPGPQLIGCEAKANALSSRPLMPEDACHVLLYNELQDLQLSMQETHRYSSKKKIARKASLTQSARRVPAKYKLFVLS